MTPLLKEIRQNPLLWLLALVPVVLVAEMLKPNAHTLLFVLSMLAIVPLAVLLSHATESVAARTGDAVGGLLNATMDLQFWSAAVAMMLIAAMTTSPVSNTGRSAWFIGTLILTVYAIFVLTLCLPPPRIS